jgi:geranylgeranyl diphosphate synthase type II
MAEWEKLLNEYSYRIENNLSNFLNKEISSASSYHSFIDLLYKNLYEYTFRGGKRLASCSSLLIYKGYADKIDSRILSVCSGIELYRHAILIHDDLVDNDKLRRGAKTIHTLYSEDYDTRFGNSVAIFAGNIYYTLAINAIINSNFDLNKILRVLNILNCAFRDVNDSQLLDLLFENKIPSVDEWYIMASKRAASLFKASMLVGANLADAPNRDVCLLKEAAENIGYCFDIQDDIIDTFATEEQYGRRPGEDLLKNKKSLHIVYTLILANQSQLEFLKNITDRNIFQKLPEIRKIISECGALKEAKNKSLQHADIAKKLILKTNMSKDVKNFYVSFINYIKTSLNWYK